MEQSTKERLRQEFPNIHNYCMTWKIPDGHPNMIFVVSVQLRDETVGVLFDPIVALNGKIIKDWH